MIDSSTHYPTIVGTTDIVNRDLAVTNILGIPIAAGILYYPLGITLKPELAFSSVSVVTNSLLLKRVGKKL